MKNSNGTSYKITTKDEINFIIPSWFGEAGESLYLTVQAWRGPGYALNIKDGKQWEFLHIPWKL